MADHNHPHTCFGCNFSKPVGPSDPAWLMCRRRAPVVIEQPGEGMRSVFPMVAPNDWCGEWERRE